jgi:hypothetical protein
MASRDLRIYRSAARPHAEREDWASAEPLYRRALKAIGELADMWADASEQARFLQNKSALAEEARHCLLALGKTEDAARLTDPLLDPEKVQCRPGEAVQERDRRLRRFGLRIMALNIIVSLCAPGISPNVGLESAKILVLPAMILILFAIAAALYLIFDFTIGRVVSLFKGSSGGVILLLSCLPWLSVIFAFLFSLFGSNRIHP